MKGWVGEGECTSGILQFASECKAMHLQCMSPYPWHLTLLAG